MYIKYFLFVYSILEACMGFLCLSSMFTAERSKAGYVLRDSTNKFKELTIQKGALAVVVQLSETVYGIISVLGRTGSCCVRVNVRISYIENR